MELSNIDYIWAIDFSNGRDRSGIKGYIHK